MAFAGQRTKVKNGSWCPVCAGRMTKSIEDVCLIVHDKEGKCISSHYKNNSSKILIECKHGHQWETLAATIFSGAWCPKCSAQKRGGTRRSGIEKAKELAKGKQGNCLSNEYKNAHVKLLWVCKEEHQWNASYNSVKSGSWCPICTVKKAALKRKLTIEEMQQIALDRSGRCLSEEYINAKTKLKWQCQKEHTWAATPDNIKSGKWCPICSRGNRKS